MTGSPATACAAGPLCMGGRTRPLAPRQKIFPPSSALTYSKFNELVIQNQVKKVTFQGESVKGELTNGQPFTTTVPNNDNTLWPTLKQHNIDTAVSPVDEGMPSLLAIFINWFP